MLNQKFWGKYFKKLKIREAKIEDISGILNIEEEVWGNRAAPKEMFKSRIQTFREGTMVAELEGKIVDFIPCTPRLRRGGLFLIK